MARDESDAAGPSISTPSTSSSILRVLKSEFYVASLIVLSTYAWTWLHYQHADIPIQTLSFSLNKLTPAAGQHGYGTWEWRVFMACAATAAWRVYRATTTVEGACFTLLGHAQVFVGVMALLVDKTLAAHYAAAFALCFLLLEQPALVEAAAVEALTPVTFKERARDPATAEPGVAHLVFLYAPWSLACRHAFGMYAELAARYSTERVRFCKLDVGEWPLAARPLGIEVSATSASLPTIVLYENGEELVRLPRRAGKSAALELHKQSVIKTFELDMRLATSLGLQTAAGNGSSGASSTAQQQRPT